MASWLWNSFCGCILLLVSTQILWVLVKKYWLNPRVLAAALAQQGIHGPPREILLGNLREMTSLRKQVENQDMQMSNHDIRGHVLPHISRWSKTYGVPFVMWWAQEPQVVIKDLDMIKEVLYNRSGCWVKSPGRRKVAEDVVGKGLVALDGEEWSTTRRMLSPAFHTDKIKGMVGAFVSCVDDMISKWKDLTSSDKVVELQVDQELAVLTADVISRAAFGSSFKEGQRVFELLQQMIPLAKKANMSLWNQSLMMQIKRMNEELAATVKHVIDARRAQKLSGNVNHYGDRDLLGLMLEEVERSPDKFTNKKLVDECKTFYGVGQGTTATLLVWTLLLLASCPSWQERTRSEVLELLKDGQKPDEEAVNKMKTVGMVLNESLRLYPPAVHIVRHTQRSLRLGNLELPVGTSVHIPVLEILHDPELWGPDAQDFNPDRFSEGVAHACKQAFAFMPFGHGPRVCIGQSFALTEAKVALSMILQHFRLQLSPNYRHSPTESLKPKHGMPMLITRL